MEPIQIISEKEISESELYKFLAKKLQVGEHNKMAIIDSMENVSDSMDLIVVRTNLKYGFRFVYDFYFKDLLSEIDEGKFAGALSKFLGIPILISSDNRNPFAWLLVSPSGKSREVFSDPDISDGVVLS